MKVLPVVGGMSAMLQLLLMGLEKKLKRED